MRRRNLISVLVLSLAVLSATFAFQRGFRQFPSDEDDVPLPADYNEKTEFTFARLLYPGIGSGYRRSSRSWATDYPKADRQFVQGVRRLSRIHIRSTEQVVNLEDPDEIFNWPWIYVVEPGHWDLPESQARKLRDYLLRGGFMMTDDFHGTWEWQVFIESMNRVFPDRPIVDLENKDAIFHVLYDLDERFQVPGIQILYTGRPYERDGFEGKWRGIYDDNGRIMVAICHNMDVGDAWEHADEPRYPEHYASLAYRIGINYIIYAMTH